MKKNKGEFFLFGPNQRLSTSRYRYLSTEYLRYRTVDLHRTRSESYFWISRRFFFTLELPCYHTLTRLFANSRTKKHEKSGKKRLKMLWWGVGTWSQVRSCSPPGTRCCNSLTPRLSTRLQKIKQLQAISFLSFPRLLNRTYSFWQGCGSGPFSARSEQIRI